MRRSLVIAIAAIVLGLSAIMGHAEKGTKESMRKKLNYAQGVLEGLTLQQFDLVVTNATLLRDMNQTNAFSRLKFPLYVACSTNFLHAVNELINAAKSEDLDRATAAYARVTRNCVDCHQTFRREQFVKAQKKAAAK